MSPFFRCYSYESRWLISLRFCSGLKKMASIRTVGRRWKRRLSTWVASVCCCCLRWTSVKVKRRSFHSAVIKRTVGCVQTPTPVPQIRTRRSRQRRQVGCVASSLSFDVANSSSERRCRSPTLCVRRGLTFSGSGRSSSWRLDKQTPSLLLQLVYYVRPLSCSPSCAR